MMRHFKQCIYDTPSCTGVRHGPLMFSKCVNFIVPNMNVFFPKLNFYDAHVYHVYNFLPILVSYIEYIYLLYSC